MTEEHVAKNLCWKVVGQRGDKRMIKGFNREAGTRGGTADKWERPRKRQGSSERSERNEGEGSGERDGVG